MPRRSKSSGKNQNKRPGSSKTDARAVGGKGDFGVREDDVPERNYTSANTRRADRGAAPERSGSTGGRTSGAGGNESGVGSSSGGDVDTDIVGIPGPDDAAGTGADTASEAPAQGAKRPSGHQRVHGSTVQSPDDRTAGPEGADAASTAGRDDDSFAGEVSSDEASGRNDAGG